MNRTKASVAQLSYLAEHMKNNAAMASAHLQNNSLQARAANERQWKKLSDVLNTLGGPTKTVTKWKQAWRDLRNNVKKKAANKSEFQEYCPGSTGNGPIIKPLTAEDEQASMLDPMAVYIMEDVVKTEPTQVTESPQSPQSSQGSFEHPEVPMSPSLVLPDNPEASQPESSTQYSGERKRKCIAPKSVIKRRKLSEELQRAQRDRALSMAAYFRAKTEKVRLENIKLRLEIEQLKNSKS